MVMVSIIFCWMYSYTEMTDLLLARRSLDLVKSNLNLQTFLLTSEVRWTNFSPLPSHCLFTCFEQMIYIIAACVDLGPLWLLQATIFNLPTICRSKQASKQNHCFVIVIDKRSWAVSVDFVEIVGLIINQIILVNIGHCIFRLSIFNWEVRFFRFMLLMF